MKKTNCCWSKSHTEMHYCKCCFLWHAGLPFSRTTLTQHASSDTTGVQQERNRRPSESKNQCLSILVLKSRLQVEISWLELKKGSHIKGNTFDGKGERDSRNTQLLYGALLNRLERFLMVWLKRINIKGPNVAVLPLKYQKNQLKIFYCWRMGVICHGICLPSQFEVCVDAKARMRFCRV